MESHSDQPVTHPPHDQLSLKLEAPPGRLRQSLKVAGRSLLRFGLGGLGGVLLGPAGLGLGTAIGALEATRSQGFKTGLLVGGLSAALGVVAMAAGPIGAAAVGLTALVVGVWHGSRQKERKGHDDPKDAELTRSFANAYLDEAKAALSGVKKENLPGLPGPVAQGRSKAAVEALAANAVFQACQVVASNLPSSVALSLSGKAAQRILDADALAKLDAAMLSSMPAEGPQPKSDNGLAEVRYANTGQMGPAVATMKTVVLDKEFVKDKDAPTLDFVVGHELSHVRHQDAVSKLGHLAFSSLLSSMAQQEPNLAKQIAVQTMLMAIGAQQSREMEFRADKEGVEFALSRGHSPQAVAQAVEKLFATEDKPESPNLADSESHDTHPPNADRTKAVLSQLGLGDLPRT